MDIGMMDAEGATRWLVRRGVLPQSALDEMYAERNATARLAANPWPSVELERACAAAKREAQQNLERARRRRVTADYFRPVRPAAPPLTILPVEGEFSVVAVHSDGEYALTEPETGFPAWLVAQLGAATVSELGDCFYGLSIF